MNGIEGSFKDLLKPNQLLDHEDLLPPARAHLALPGLVPGVDSPTQRMSDLSPTSATSPTSRSRVESGNTTTMMEDEVPGLLTRTVLGGVCFAN